MVKEKVQQETVKNFCGLQPTQDIIFPYTYPTTVYVWQWSPVSWIKVCYRDFIYG